MLQDEQETGQRAQYPECDCKRLEQMSEQAGQYDRLVCRSDSQLQECRGADDQSGPDRDEP